MTCRTVSSAALWLAIPLSATLALANCGCLLVAAGTAAGAATGIAYVNGNVSATYFAYPRDVWMATMQGLTELGMPLMNQTFDGVKGSLESKTADGDKVFVSMECLSPPNAIDGAFTRLSIRIAHFGDRKGSERIFQQIGSHIAAPMLPQTTNPGGMPGGAGMGAAPVGSGVKSITAANYAVPAPSGNPIPSLPSSQTILPTSGSIGSEPPLADPVAGDTPMVPKLPISPVPTEPSRGNGA